jgi:hypothetical protein
MTFSLEPRRDRMTAGTIDKRGRKLSPMDATPLTLPRGLLLAMAAAAVIFAAGPAAARCATELKSADRALEGMDWGKLERSRAARELAAAKQATSERLCQRHLQAALTYIHPNEAVETRHAKPGGPDCALDATCPSYIKPQETVKTPHGRFGGPNCRRDASCPD